MDLPSLAVILQAALSHNPEERKAAEESLNQFQYAPQHLVRLLQIIVDSNCDMAVRHVASIHFKNFVAKHWSPNEPDEPQKISASDKGVVRENILVFIAQIPPLLRAQLGECLKTIIHADYPEQWPTLLHWINHNLQNQQVYGSLYVLRILSRKYEFGDLKLQKPENKAFAQMFQKNYAGKILECHLRLLNIVRSGDYLPDRVINLVLQYLSSSISKNTMYHLLQPHLDVVLFEIIFPLMCFNDNDQKLWNEDPHEYVRKGYDIIEDLYSPRTAAMDFVSELRMSWFHRYDEAPVGVKSYRQKDGALLAIGALCDKLKQTEPYKSELEPMLVQHVFPEFNSPVGHLRAKVLPWSHVRMVVFRQYSLQRQVFTHLAKAAWVAGQYAHINFNDQNNFRNALHCVVSGMRDPELPVRVDSVFALRSFVEACKEFFKLMDEVENEDLVFTLETVVDKFGEEMAPYALGLCQNLASAFWKCMDMSEADDEGDDSGALAAVGCLRAISTILESVSRLPHLFVQIEPTLLPIMRRMLTTEGQEVIEEVLEIVSYMTFFSPTISLDMWSLWPLIIEALGDWAIDFFDNILVPLDNFISRSTEHFLTCKDPDYRQSLWNMLSSVMSDKNMEDGDIEPAPKLIEVVFQNCKGKVDQWVEPYLRITVERLRRTEKPYLKCLLMLVMLQKVKKSGVRANFRREHDKKVCCLGLTSLLALPADQLPVEALGRVFKASLDLLVAYKDQLAESEKEDGGDEDDDDMDGLQTDEDEEYDSDKEMGDDTEEGDEADSIRLQKLAAQRNSRETALREAAIVYLLVNLHPRVRHIHVDIRSDRSTGLCRPSEKHFDWAFVDTYSDNSTDLCRPSKEYFD
ncbi:hypothetical protein QJS10_CPA02g00514 [Acorus calamus]|uniref:Importin N-terminal domain-containing protein n=1 Tax=Acorus calamus TaxID=4465 RepID=A0AAV9FFI0_ACOCL|nr:hypothetical protein QJS10_CPA02g00514 [Acorus calamus]